MDNGISVGILVVLTFTSTIFILQSGYFTKTQKIILGILFVFPPAQWFLGIIIGFWNKYNDTTIGFKIDSAKKSTQELGKLKEFGVISEQEYKEKSEKIIKKKQDELFLKSEEYKSLKRLKSNGILTQTEFEEKSELLKNKILEQVNSSEFENTDFNEIIIDDDVNLKEFFKKTINERIVKITTELGNCLILTKKEKGYQINDKILVNNKVLKSGKITQGLNGYILIKNGRIFKIK